MGISVLTSLHITVYSALRFVSLKWPHQFTCYTIKKAKVSKIVLPYHFSHQLIVMLAI